MVAKRIYRNQREKVIGGVCAGIADYFDVDVTWIRLAFVLSIFAKGFGIVAYIIAWIVFPRDERTGSQLEADRARGEAPAKARGDAWRQGLNGGSRNVVGIILILLGVLFFLDQNFYWFGFDTFWPVILIGLGIFLLMRASEPHEEGAADSAYTPAVATEAPGAPAAASESDPKKGETDA
jgi:phage shock protein C